MVMILGVCSFVSCLCRHFSFCSLPDCIWPTGVELHLLIFFFLLFPVLTLSIHLLQAATWNGGGLSKMSITSRLFCWSILLRDSFTVWLLSFLFSLHVIHSSRCIKLHNRMTYTSTRKYDAPLSNISACSRLDTLPSEEHSRHAATQASNGMWSQRGPWESHWSHLYICAFLCLLCWPTHHGCPQASQRDAVDL